MNYFLMTNPLVGRIKQIINAILQKYYKFDPWHKTPINYRPYAQKIVKYVNENCISGKDDTVVEIGCGLGEIIKYIKSPNRVGYDISNEVLKAASLLNKKASFKQGTFQNVKERKITVLITVNFIHGISPEILKEEYERLINNCSPQFIIVDEVRSKKYKYNHKFTEILPDSYCVVKKMGKVEAFKGYRYIYVYKRNTN